MYKRVLWTLCVVAVLVVVSAPLCAQSEKPPMYSYVANWAFPRAQWADVEKNRASLNASMQKAVSAGSIIGFGDDTYVIHQGDGETHDNWFSSTSMAGLMTVLEQLTSSGASTSTTNTSATKHWDNLFVAKYYNYKPGTYKGFGRGASYVLKKEAPADGAEQLSKEIFVPFLEKLFADGIIVEYEIDLEAVHTSDPGTIFVYYICPTAESLDKAAAALQAWRKDHVGDLVKFNAMTDNSQHRDILVRANATYK